jgi:predicted amidophosphoribosyltransferase
MELEYAGARSAFVHTGVARRLVVEFKSGGQPVLASVMASLARPSFVSTLASLGECERLVVTWVPSHRSTQRERGYNQAELLARALCSEHPGLLAVGLLQKPVRTRHQKELDRVARQDNLRGAFVLDHRALAALPFRPAGFMLVDDVYTTGATVQEVSSVLHSGTGVPIHVFTFSLAASRKREGHD